jgi:hypothetical protein
MHPHGVNLRTARGTGSHLTARQAVESDRQFLTIPAFGKQRKTAEKNFANHSKSVFRILQFALQRRLQAASA